MAKEFQYSRWLNIAVREIFTEIEKCCSNKKEGELENHCTIGGTTQPGLIIKPRVLFFF